MYLNRDSDPFHKLRWFLFAHFNQWFGFEKKHPVQRTGCFDEMILRF